MLLAHLFDKKVLLIRYFWYKIQLVTIIGFPVIKECLESF